ncbi:hypothetical protein N474_01615 [Pseudoalteromonas luteoviolacea CPMOR-2]|uniref:Uncharacterized protein n=1 Tax=Pseudoalteromonas luteoviolacea DSM 6061 TaxID=1365250 RepID=A0A166WTZ9_9GAMM|nr:hypothetical protein N475_15720 [Pseudoalteromonas luteoviolacea DSM 6061]KZN54440.1 hypothetical protein N474_01615 [Pseudoalteromonas luteoviolacea CPMOR-2]MBE0388906.1 hypothetical protein [Pseudoalteromonas luteoviolacea DSM 6061]
MVTNWAPNKAQNRQNKYAHYCSHHFTNGEINSLLFQQKIGKLTSQVQLL